MVNVNWMLRLLSVAMRRRLSRAPGALSTWSHDVQGMLRTAEENGVISRDTVQPLRRSWCMGVGIAGGGGLAGA